MSATVVGYLQHGRFETGLWCEPCALPSVVRTTIYLLGTSGDCSPMGTVAVCAECHRETFGDE